MGERKKEVENGSFTAERLFIAVLVLSEKTVFAFSSVVGVHEMLFDMESELEGILRSEEFGDCVVLPGDRDTDADSL